LFVLTILYSRSFSKEHHLIDKRNEKGPLKVLKIPTATTLYNPVFEVAFGNFNEIPALALTNVVF